MSFTTGAELHHRHERRGYTLEQALNRVYLIKSYGGKATLHLPMVLAGKRVKIVLVEEDKGG